MPFTATVLTMFPEAFPGPLGVSLIGTAWREKGLWDLQTLDIRAFSEDKRGFLDDTPAGGGPGIPASPGRNAPLGLEPPGQFRRNYLSALLAAATRGPYPPRGSVGETAGP